jgi:hypothetical protein
MMLGGEAAFRGRLVHSAWCFHGATTTTRRRTGKLDWTAIGVPLSGGKTRRQHRPCRNAHLRFLSAISGRLL